MMKRLSNYSTTWGRGQTVAYPEKLIRGFLKHAVGKLQRVRTGISGIIVLADDVMTAEDAFAD
eukprot:2968201-Amphidinium_carterae.1